MPKDTTTPAAPADQEKFRQIAQRRTNTALHSIGALVPLANRERYDYTEEQADKIVSALRAELDKLESAFKAGGKKAAEFTL
jgi:hypothetical protein